MFTWGSALKARLRAGVFLLLVAALIAFAGTASGASPGDDGPSGGGGRVDWAPSRLERTLSAGQMVSASVAFSVSTPLARPTFLVTPDDDDGSVTVDPAGLPAVLSPGTSYEVTVRIVGPRDRRAARLNRQVWLREGERRVEPALQVRAEIAAGPPPETPTRTPTATPTPTWTPLPTDTPSDTPTSSPTDSPTPQTGYGCPCSVWDDATRPGLTDNFDGSPVELGVKFRTEASGAIAGVRFYKGVLNGGTHTAALWSAAGERLATATFGHESAAGWQRVDFSSPVPVAANTTYVVSYHSDSGYYALDEGYFAHDAPNGPIRLLRDGEQGGNGVYAYGGGGVAPSDSYNQSNYWVDVVFTTDQPDLVPPRVIGQSPIDGAGNVDPNAPITLTFAEQIRAESLRLALVGPAGEVPATASYDAASRTASFRPAGALALSAHYTATLQAAADLAGNGLAAPLAWSFGTAAAPSSSGHSDTAPGALVLSATFNTIGVELPFVGDDDGDASATLRYRRAGEAAWHEALPLWETNSLIAPGRAFYGSVLKLDAGVAYDVEVAVADSDGIVGPTVLDASVRTRAEDLVAPGGLAASRFVRADGDDANDGTSPASAWRTLDKAIAAAPDASVVQVGPGYYRAPAGALARPITLVAEHPAVDDAQAIVDAGSHSVIESGPVSGPSGATEPGVVHAPWTAVASAPCPVWRWSGVPLGPGHLGFLGYASTREAQPQRVALWKTSATPAPADWIAALCGSPSYNYGWAAFGAAGGSDVYARLPADADPNALYMSLGGDAAFQITGGDVRVSGFEIRPASGGVELGPTASRGTVDHNLIVVGFAGVRFNGDHDATPNRYGADHVVERNRIVDSNLWSDDPSKPAIPWLFIKGERIGEGNETTGVWSVGGARRVVVRRNTIDGPFNGVGAYNAGFDRYATQDQDVYGNTLRHISDDAFEPEQVGINWRIWGNRVDQTSTVLSTGPLAFGPLYLFQNAAWRTGKDGVGRNNDGSPGVGAVFFKYSGESNPAAQLYVVNNTFWTDSTAGDPLGSQTGVDGAAQYAGSGPSAERFVLRNNLMRATRYAFQYDDLDEQANSLSTTDASRGLSALGRTWTSNVAEYRVAYLAARGAATTTNVGWDEATGLGAFISPPDSWLQDPGAGDLRPTAGSPLVHGGIAVANIAEADASGAPNVGAYGP